MLCIGVRYCVALSLLVPACEPGSTGQESGRSSTTGGSQADDSNSGSGPGPTTTATSSTTTGTTTGDPPPTSSSETGESIPCDVFLDCPSPGSICIFDGAGRHLRVCAENPDGCIPGPVCSPACAALCTANGGYCPDQDPGMPEYLNCPSKCDTFALDPGCPRGEKCIPDGYCTPIDRYPVPVGEPCPDATPDPCVDHAYCAFGSDGTCLPFCTGSEAAPICPPASDCAGLGLAHVCVPTCDPLAPDCQETEICVVNPDQTGRFICAPDKSGPAGALYSPCEFLNTCDLGLFCSDANNVGICDPNANGCCLPYCDLDAPMCPDNLECVAWHKIDPPPGLEDVGACSPPP